MNSNKVTSETIVTKVVNQAGFSTVTSYLGLTHSLRILGAQARLLNHGDAARSSLDVASAKAVR